MNAKALTIQQPHAWEMTDRGKRLENRTWFTSYRGELWIHAGKSRERADRFPDGVDLVFGAVVAHADLFDCQEAQFVEKHAVIDGFDQEEFREGRVCLMLMELVKLPESVPCRGAQGIFNLPPDVEAECRRQLDMAKRKAKKTKTNPPKSETPPPAGETQPGYPD
jgi:hypothetical protein